MKKSAQLEKIMLAAPVIPVVVVNDPKLAVLMAKALVAGGLPAIEITLRTAHALECIKAVVEEVEGAIAGAGTVLDPKQIQAVEKAGARFMVSPGTSPIFIKHALESAVPLLPGIATSSEAMALGELGLEHLKFFPAEAAGGANYLKSLGGPLPHFKFCPTGGVSLGNAENYLKLPNVLCVGGSWVAPNDLMEQGDWAGIEKLAREASNLGG